MLVVIALMVLLLALLGPAISSMTQSKGFTAAAYDIGGLFDKARSYAMAKNTYVFVGLLQVPYNSDINSKNAKFMDQPDPKTGSSVYGSLVACAIASRDGTSGFQYSSVKPTWTSNYNNGKNFTMLGKILRWDNTQMVSLPIASDTKSKMYRTNPAVGSFTAMILGDPKAISLTPFSIPLGSSLNAGKLNFVRVVMFDPQGISRLVSTNEVDAVSYVMEVGLVPTHGSMKPVIPTAGTVSKSNSAALQFNAMTGSYNIFRP